MLVVNNVTLVGGGGGGLHLSIGPHNMAELREIHTAAAHTAVYYVVTIVMVYLLGLAAIAIHHMNSSYGGFFAWTMSDLWEDICPAAAAALRGKEEKDDAMPRIVVRAGEKFGNLLMAFMARIYAPRHCYYTRWCAAEWAAPLHFYLEN